jgi:hypothetical protein
MERVWQRRAVPQRAIESRKRKNYAEYTENAEFAETEAGKMPALPRR